MIDLYFITFLIGLTGSAYSYYAALGRALERDA